MSYCICHFCCVNQTVKAWGCFANCKTETNFAELQMMQIRQLQTEHFKITFILQTLKLNSLFLLGRRRLLQPVNQSKQLQSVPGSHVSFLIFCYIIDIAESLNACSPFPKLKKKRKKLKSSPYLKRIIV